MKSTTLSVTSLLTLGAVVRAVLIIYGAIHDSYFKVKYTDVDYTVFSSAAKAICEGNSPYTRRDYRYSPLLAVLMVPTCLGSIFTAFGKILFSFCDIACAAIIYKLLAVELTEANRKKQSKSLLAAVALWLFNPIVCIISTRGNCDSLVSILLLTTLLFASRRNAVITGLLFGLSVHFRLYPVIYLPAFLMYFGNSGKSPFNLFSPRGVWRTATSLFTIQNFVFLAMASFALLTSTMFWYYLYGQEFLQSSLLYHLSRQDIKHNFSVYFYSIYLQAPGAFSPSVGIGLIFGSQLLLIGLISIVLVRNGELRTLNTALFLITLVFVVFNKVYTVQYYTWYFCLLPLLDFRPLWKKLRELGQLAKRYVPVFPGTPASVAVSLLAFWLSSQAAWLTSAYFLEFGGKNTFLFIWLSGLSLLVANSAVIVICILSKS